MNKKDVIEYGKYISRNPYDFMEEFMPVKLTWYQKLYLKTIGLFSKRKDIVMTTDDDEIITFRNGSVVKSIKSDGCIRGQRVKHYSMLYDWNNIDMEVINEVLKEFESK